MEKKKVDALHIIYIPLYDYIHNRTCYYYVYSTQCKIRKWTYLIHSNYKRQIITVKSIWAALFDGLYNIIIIMPRLNSVDCG